MNQTNYMGDLTNYVKVIDAAASKNDRWLFIATLTVGLVILWLIAKYFVQQHAGLIADHKEARSLFHTQLLSLVTQVNESNGKMIICLDHNTQALNRSVKL